MYVPFVNHIFVYGTLRAGHHANRSFGMDRLAKHVQTCDLFGAAIYHLGGFPGLLFTDNPYDFVTGDLYEIKDARLLESLDSYEGYHEDDPERSLYIRRTIEVLGKKAYTYEYNGVIRDQATRIKSGDWDKAA